MAKWLLLLWPILCVEVLGSMEITGSVASPSMPRDEAAVQLSYSQCFLGLFFSTCKIYDQYDDDYLYINALPYYRNFNDNYGNPYCLQCCGEGTDIDYWNLKCETSEGGPVTNMYGYEVRFARNKFIGDRELIYCPIRRTVCDYNETSNTETCDEDLVQNDQTYLHGITIELYVRKIYYSFSSWREVTFCNVTADERNYSLPVGDLFEENYIMHHEVGPYEYDAVGLVLLSLLSILAIYAILYYCRRQRCFVCQKKLVVFKDRCYLCRFYGAHMPDPVLIKALEEKAQHEQGEYPQRFWCSKKIVSFCRSLSSCCFNFSKCMSYLCCCQCCCCCCKSRGEQCKDKSCQKFCCCLFWCEAAEEVHPEDASELESHQEDGEDTLHDGTRKRKKKINPYIIKKHPYMIHRAIDHPHPVDPPTWVKKRVPEGECMDEESGFTISTKKTPFPETTFSSESSSDSDDY